MAWSRCLISTEAEQLPVAEGGEGSFSISATITKGTLALGKVVWSTGNLEGWDFWAQEAQEDHWVLRDSVHRTRKLLTAESSLKASLSTSPTWDCLSPPLHCGTLSCRHEENATTMKPGQL